MFAVQSINMAFGLIGLKMENRNGHLNRKFHRFVLNTFKYSNSNPINGVDVKSEFK